MLAERLLSRLDGVRKTGADRWIARCPAHEDRSPSLSIRDLGDRVLVHDFGGCSAVDVLAAVGLELSALFEATERRELPHKEQKPFPAADVLCALSADAMLIYTFGTALSEGKCLSSQDRQALLEAVSRFRNGARFAGAL